MAVKASDHIKYDSNPNGPIIATAARLILRQDGLYFKDIDGSFPCQRLEALRCGKAYAHRDTAGNDYPLNFGLGY